MPSYVNINRTIEMLDTFIAKVFLRTSDDDESYSSDAGGGCDSQHPN